MPDDQIRDLPKGYAIDFDGPLNLHKDVLLAAINEVIDPTPGAQPADTAWFHKNSCALAEVRLWVKAGAAAKTVTVEFWTRPHSGSLINPDDHTDASRYTSQAKLLAIAVVTFSGRTCVNKNPITGAAEASTTYYSASGVAWTWLIDPDIVKTLPDSASTSHPATDKELDFVVNLFGESDLYLAFTASSGSPTKCIASIKRVA